MPESQQEPLLDSSGEPLPEPVLFNHLRGIGFVEQQRPHVRLRFEHVRQSLIYFPVGGEEDEATVLIDMSPVQAVYLAHALLANEASVSPAEEHVVPPVEPES
ncbi:MAG: hypothetical protein F4Y95_07325 [Chloroflexi bacterium]|nr:hypothetical protein [Chloroflexota bacterium]